LKLLKYVEFARSEPSRWRLIGWVSICAVLWGSAFPGIKLVFAHWQALGVEVDFATRSLFAGVRFGAAGFALLVLAKHPLKQWHATPLRWIVLMAATQTVGQYVFFYLGLSLSSGALASLLVASGSFWWVIIAPYFLGAPQLTLRQWLVLGVGATGITLAVYSPGVSEGSPRWGGLLILIANLFGAFGLLAFQKIKPSMGARAGTGFSLILGGLVLVALGIPAIAAGKLGLFDGYVLGWTAWLAFVSAAAFSLWNHLSTIFPAPLLATYRFLIPLCGVFESLWLLDNETLTPAMVMGGGIVLIAMTLTQKTRSAAT
jgi:drug/metabolite transporter (DMT)-like permease